MQSMKDLLGFKIHAADDLFGKVKDVYFDDHSWRVRYFVVDTGTWLSERKVLLSPASAGVPDWREKSIPVVLNRVQVENAPPISSDMPISRRYEEELSEYYTWPRYWAATGLPSFDIAAVPQNPVALPPDVTTEPEGFAEGRKLHGKGDPNLRSLKEALGYRIKAVDDEIGYLKDLLGDAKHWQIQSMLVDTGNWLPGQKVLISCAAVLSVTWESGQIGVSMTKSEIENSPAYRSR